MIQNNECYYRNNKKYDDYIFITNRLCSLVLTTHVTNVVTNPLIISLCWMCLLSKVSINVLY